MKKIKWLVIAFTVSVLGCSSVGMMDVMWPEANIVKLVVPSKINQQWESRGVIWVSEWTIKVDVNIYRVQHEMGERKLYLLTHMSFTDLKRDVEYFNPLIPVVFYLKGLPYGEYEILVRASNKYNSTERRTRFRSAPDPIQPRYRP